MFRREKETILKITNMILLIWLVGSIAVLYAAVTAYFFEEPKMTREEFNCYGYYYEAKPTTDNTQEQCDQNYAQYLSEQDNRNYDLTKGIYLALGNVVIVSTAIYFLNRKKED